MLILDYIWVGNDNSLYSKTRIMKLLNESDFAFFNGYITGESDHNEVLLIPKKVIKNPLSEGNYLILADTWTYNEDNELIPHISNKRHFCEKELKRHPKQNIFEFKQDFYILDSLKRPYKHTNAYQVTNNYCKVGNGSILGREIVLKVLQCCMDCDLNITEINPEKGPAQWSFKIKGDDIDAPDQLILFKYILSQVCEQYDVYPEFSPVPHIGFNPSGCSLSFSTDKMRESYDHIQNAIKYLAKNHHSSFKQYGDNNNRLSLFERQTFTYGISKNGVSVCIPQTTFMNKKGWIIDTRPASDSNPYEVVSYIMDTIH